VALASALVGFTLGMAACSSSPSDNPDQTTSGGEATSDQVHLFCGKCHAYPPADTFPRSAWRKEVEQGYTFFHESKFKLTMKPPPLESVVKYYEKRAPQELPLLKNENAPGECPVRFRPNHFAVTGQPSDAAIANVNLVRLFHPRKLDVLACDMKYGGVAVLQPYKNPPTSRILAYLNNPCHAEVADFDGRGIKDIVVADLGSFTPTNAWVGRVVLLKGARDGTFKPITLLDGVGRVADVQVADFNGDGKLDLVVAVFGWRDYGTGKIIYLENQTTDWSRPKFIPHVLDDRNGAIHVPVVPHGLTGSGKPDFVALISQEHETIVAFLNDGKGNFRKETIYTGPHPAYGSSGIQLVDLNGDGKIDVLYTNGDVLDSQELKPYHSIQWLENKGKFPFEHHHITYMYGVHRAVAADIQGKGTKDIVAVSFLPENRFPQAGKLELDSIIYLEQTAPGKFVRRSLQKAPCRYVTCALGDLYGDGKTHLVTGDFVFSPNIMNPKSTSLTIWENLGPRKKPGAK
jgi:hypothetical protein